MIALKILLALAGAARGELQESPPIPADTEIKTTDSGLKYSVLREGQGEDTPKFSDTVIVHYTGWLVANGKLFDTSRGDVPAEFKLGAVIEGWNEGLGLMTRGSRFKLTIPAELGYGKAGYQPNIPADSELIFDVELIDFLPGPGLPEFRKLDPDAATDLACGVPIQIVDEGTGVKVTEDTKIILNYTAWSLAGKLVQASMLMPRGALKASPGEIRAGFMKEALLALNTGGKAILKVPHSLAFQGIPEEQQPEGGFTYWYLTLHLAPEMPDLEKVEWQKTESGLEYFIEKPGTGAKPRMGEAVRTRYTGWFLSGESFDSTAGGYPAKFTIGGVIRGWNEGLALIGEGGSILLRVPGDLAYGPQGRPGIPPNETLVFRVELVRVEP